MINNITYRLLFIVLALFTSCQRQTIYEPDIITAIIPVSVNWDNSGITPTREHDQHRVHRVSLRFFPKDGSAPFESYLEGNVFSGNIEVPVGEYSVIAMNESVHDVYWSDFYSFSDIDSYSKISVTTIDDNPLLYNFYVPFVGERFMKESHRLTSWSLDDYSVTHDMVTRTRSAKNKADNEEFVINVEMRRLTHDIKVFATVENLKSVHIFQGAVRGFSKRIYLASTKSVATPATQFFTLNGRKFNPGSTTDGTSERTFRSFGRLSDNSTAKYSMMLDVIFVDGSRYNPEIPLEWDLSDQINSQEDSAINIELSLNLPLVEGGIGVGGWGDDEDIIIQ